MKTICSLLSKGRRGTEGQDLIEYALLAAFIALAAAASTGLVGASLDGWYEAVSGSIALFPTIL